MDQAKTSDCIHRFRKIHTNIFSRVGGLLNGSVSMFVLCLGNGNLMRNAEIMCLKLEKH